MMGTGNRALMQITSMCRDEKTNNSLFEMELTGRT